jgi:ABC-type nitrate/sulfonate/bicarbonate transport system permease component
VNSITTGIRGIIWKVAPVILFFALWESAARFGSFSAVDIFPPFSTVLLEIIRSLTAE